jgi:choline dehydrogenase-like flavoprotein
VAGLTLATRLSEDASKSVLVLEAGRSGVNEYVLHMPYYFSSATEC